MLPRMAWNPSSGGLDRLCCRWLRPPPSDTRELPAGTYYSKDWNRQPKPVRILVRLAGAPYAAANRNTSILKTQCCDKFQNCCDRTFIYVKASGSCKGRPHRHEGKGCISYRLWDITDTEYLTDDITCHQRHLRKHKRYIFLQITGLLSTILRK